jgi:hypothetical protein
MIAVVAVWAAWYTARQRNRPAFGTIIVAGTPFAIDACKKVAVAGPDAIGADLGGSHGNVVRFVRDEHGDQLWFYANGPSGVAIPVDRRDCTQWEVGLLSEATGPLSPVGGDVNFTCVVGGRKIDGAVFFEHWGS